MNVIFDCNQYAHEPIVQLFAGRLVEAPEGSGRARQLLRGAANAGLESMPARDHGWDPILEVHDQGYVDFLKQASLLWKELPEAGPEVVPHIHPVRYSRTRPNGILGLAGYYMNGTNCPIGPNTCSAAYSSAQTAITGAQLLSSGHQSAYALCRPPGHHAHADLAAGFCFLNNCAIAASVLTKKFGNVGIIDIDVHHGNGTQEIFYRRDDVFCGSVHADPSDFYPFYQGYADEIGEGRGKGWNANLPLKRGSGTEEVAHGAALLLNKAKELGCSAIVVALGFDTFAGDPMGVFNVSTDGFTEIASVFAHSNLPTLFVQEGGYDGPHLCENVEAFLRGVRASSTPENTAIAGTGRTLGGGL
jgi:acetoin utilization deacetylase AcuC-like enzyme